MLPNFVGSVKASCPRRDITNACFWAPLQAYWFRSSAAVVGFHFSRPSSAAVAAGQDPTSLSLGISAQEINLQMQPCTVENAHPKPSYQVLVPITKCLQIFTEEVTELARPCKVFWRGGWVSKASMFKAFWAGDWVIVASTYKVFCHSAAT